MVLLVAVVLGLTAGLARAIKGKRPYQPNNLKYPWLVLIGFAPQFFAFNFHPTQLLLSRWAAVALVSSQLLLLAFALANIKNTPFWALGLGLLSNFIVIALNGGLMPIQPEVVQKLIPGGYFFAGHSESLQNMGLPLVLAGPVVYRKCV